MPANPLSSIAAHLDGTTPPSPGPSAYPAEYVASFRRAVERLGSEATWRFGTNDDFRAGYQSGIAASLREFDARFGPGAAEGKEGGEHA